MTVATSSPLLAASVPVDRSQRVRGFHGDSVRCFVVIFDCPSSGSWSPIYYHIGVQVVDCLDISHLGVGRQRGGFKRLHTAVDVSASSDTERDVTTIVDRSVRGHSRNKSR